MSGVYFFLLKVMFSVHVNCPSELDGVSIWGLSIFVSVLFSVHCEAMNRLSVQWKTSLTINLDANYMASFKWAVLCAWVVVQACVCGAGMWPVQAAPVWDSWGGTQTQRERESRAGWAQTCTTNIGLVSKCSRETERRCVCLHTGLPQRWSCMYFYVLVRFNLNGP